MLASVSVGRTSVISRFMVLSLLQSSHPGLARAPIMCNHFTHGNKHVITCLARLFLASCTALELIYDPTNSRLSPSPPTRTVHQVTLSSCARRLPDSVQSNVGGTQEGSIPIVRSSIQCFLPLKFSSSSKHCVSDCFRPCCHMLHSIVPQRKISLSDLIFCNNAVFSCKSSLSSVLSM